MLERDDMGSGRADTNKFNKLTQKNDKEKPSLGGTDTAWCTP